MHKDGGAKEAVLPPQWCALTSSREGRPNLEQLLSEVEAKFP